MEIHREKSYHDIHNPDCLIPAPMESGQIFPHLPLRIDPGFDRGINGNSNLIKKKKQQ